VKVKLLRNPQEAALIMRDGVHVAAGPFSGVPLPQATHRT
jgi:hypothetical protein